MTRVDEFVAGLRSGLNKLSAQGLAATPAYAELYKVYSELSQWNPLLAEQTRIRQCVTTKDTTNCLACGSFHTAHPRSLYGSQMRNLISLWWNTFVTPHKNLDAGYLHKSEFCSDINSGGGDFAKLRYWGFVEEMSNADPSKKTSGAYKLLAFGKAFVESSFYTNHYAQPVCAWSRCWVYQGEVIEWDVDSKPVTIVEALGDKFDYRTLMQGNA